MTCAAIVIFAGWLLVTGLVFSFMAGIYHDYYTVALAPAVAGTIAVSASELWRQRSRWVSRIGLSAATGVTATWAVVLLARASEPYPSLRLPIALIGAIATIALLFVGRCPRMLGRLVIAMAGIGSLIGPAAYSLHTVAHPHQGSIVTAGPVEPEPGSGGLILYGPPPGEGNPGTDGRQQPGSRQPGGRGGAPEIYRVGGPGGFLGGDQADPDLVARLRAGAEPYTWVAATTGSQAAATYQLATGLPVMAIGGFNGSDPSPTLTEFQRLVAEGKIHYYLGGAGDPERGRMQNGGSRAAEEIAAWVADTFTKTSVGGIDVYDLTAGR